MNNVGVQGTLAGDFIGGTDRSDAGHRAYSWQRARAGESPAPDSILRSTFGTTHPK